MYTVIAVRLDYISIVQVNSISLLRVMFDWAQKVNLNDFGLVNSDRKYLYTTEDLADIPAPLNDTVNVWFSAVELHDELFFCNIFKNPKTCLFDTSEERPLPKKLYTYVGCVDGGVFVSQVSGTNIDDTRELFFENTEFWNSKDSLRELKTLKDKFLSEDYRCIPMPGLPNVFKFVGKGDLSEILILCIITEVP